MLLLTDATHGNIRNSVSAYLADHLLALGYVVYWHDQDGLETNSGFWPQYQANQATYALNSTFAAEVAAAKGMVTLMGDLPANPTFVTRPTSSGAVDGQESIPIPAFAVELGDATPVRPYELGSQVKDRVRLLMVLGFARTAIEQRLFADNLANWFDQNVHLTVKDHDGSTLATLGTVDVGPGPIVESAIVVDDAEAETYEVELHARLEYVA